MKTLLISLLVAAGLAGCATPRENAILGGAILGAAATAIFTNPQPQPKVHQHYPPPRPIYCQTHLVGYDVYHRPIYRQVCQ